MNLHKHSFAEIEVCVTFCQQDSLHRLHTHALCCNTCVCVHVRLPVGVSSHAWQGHTEEANMLVSLKASQHQVPAPGPSLWQSTAG